MPGRGRGWLFLIISLILAFGSSFQDAQARQDLWLTKAHDARRTWGEGAYETHAFYAVNPDSTLQWRYPTETSLTHRFFASPALSPEASTVYVSSFRDFVSRYARVVLW